MLSKEFPMPSIVVSRDLGADVVTREHGKRLRKMLEPHLESPPVIIDFENLEITSVSFFDEAFGQLALQCGESILDAVRLERISPFDLALVKDIVHSRAQEGRKRALRG
jgi:hypothetical protein